MEDAHNEEDKTVTAHSPRSALSTDDDALARF